MRVAGVDGRRGGWVVAVVETASPESSPASASLLVDLRYDDTLAGVLADPSITAIAVDMPIGLPGAEGSRACDVAARRILRPYGSRVFPAPVRAALGHADDYSAACAASVDVCGKAMSRQAWNLLPAMAQADEAADDPRVVECHPELSFALLIGRPVEEVKGTAAGRDRRLAVLRTWLPDLDDPRYGADGLDALACAWTASRVAAGTAVTLPPGPVPLDDRGRPMRIVA